MSVRVVLNNDIKGELIVDDTNYVSWQERSNLISKSETYHGVIITETLDITFIGYAYEWILDLDNSYDIAAQCDVKIQLYTGVNGWQNDFVGIIDFTTKKRAKGKNGKQVTYSAYSDDFAKKLLEREKIKIPYDRLETLDGETITPFTNEYETVTIEGTEIKNVSPFDVTETVVTGGLKELYPPLVTSGKNGFRGTVLLSNADALAAFEAPDYQWIEDRIFYKSEGFTGTLSGDISINWKNNGESKTRFRILDYRNSLTPNIVYDSGEADRDDASGNGSFDFSINLTIYENSKLTFAWENTDFSLFAFTDVGGDLTDLDLVIKKTSTDCDFVPPLQAWERTIEAITGNSNAVLSDLLETGDASTIFLTNGKLIRGYPTGNLPSLGNDNVSQLKFSNLDLFKNYDALFNIGAGVEYVNEQYNLRIEEREYFYQSEILLEIPKSSIKKNSTESEKNLDWYYSEIQTGYEFERVEDDGALNDFNTKSTYSSPIVFENKLENLADYIGSPYAIEQTRRNQFDNNNTIEYKYDNNNFFFSVYDNSGTWIQRTNEGFLEINGIDEVSTYMNLIITPKRMLNSKSWLINTGLKGYTGGVLTYNESEITTNLATRTNTESELVTENENITINNLDESLFSGEIIRFSAPVGSSTFNLLKQNPYKLIKFWDDLKDAFNYGWIKEVSTNPIDKETNWELIEAKSFTEGESFRLLQDGSYRLLEDGSLRLLE